jgi:hypothetical protein
MLEELGEVAWSVHAQPDGNQPDAVPTSLRALATSSTQDESRAAYNTFLFAVGNNHAGTYFPVVLAALPFLGEVLRLGGDWARIAVLDILIDLNGSFAPAPGFERIIGAPGDMRQLEDALHRETARLSPLVRAAFSAGATKVERELAGELLGLLTEKGETR